MANGKRGLEPSTNKGWNVEVEQFPQALSIGREVGDRCSEVDYLDNPAMVSGELGQFQESACL
jgi:hypothetical protein